MIKTIWTAAMVMAMAIGIVSHAAAADGDSVTFRMARAAGATCLPNDAHARVTISDLGSVQNMHVEVVDLTPNTSFTLFIVQHPVRPFGLSWYQGDIQTDSEGRGAADFTGIFSEETFILSDTSTKISHLGIWFADPNDSANAGCSDTVTPFDGDGVAGILVLSTSNFKDDHGPLLNLKETELQAARKR